MIKSLIKKVLGSHQSTTMEEEVAQAQVTIDTVNRNPRIKRYDIINALIEKHGYTSYVEIGVRNPNECFSFINCKEKYGVDPGIEADFPVDFNMTSDAFFAQNTRKYDLIFIDGLHIDDQVKRDIENALAAITPNGTIVLHDCNPPDLHHAREDYYDFNTPATVYWNGTVWKAIVDFRASENALSYSCVVVNTDYGIGIIRPDAAGKKIINDNPFYAFRKFEQERERYIGLVSIEQFENTYLDKPIQSSQPKA
jgi:hypothetical protein